MRKVLLGFTCLSLLIASAALAGTASDAGSSPAASPAVEAACPAQAGAAGLFEPAVQSPQVGVPAPIPLACEHNFCTHERDACALSCAPCSFSFRCRNVACEATCTCTC